MVKMLCSLIPKKKRVGAKIPVYLNVYDLTPINGYAYWFGLGVYHSGVQVHGVEYAFGAHDHPTTGVFEVEPKQCPGFTFRKSILIGRTDLGTKEVRTLIEKLSTEYLGNTYHLISKNCNHFCNDLSIRLTSKQIPRWVNRLARLGLLCKCVLPAALDETKVHHIKPESKPREDSTKKMRSKSSRYEPSTPSPTPTTLSTCSSAPASKSRRQRRCVPPTSSAISSSSQRESVNSSSSQRESVS
ncbi:hypothetical protein RND81_08G202700 [Saponaria officinalis]|uniref:PPPDE domain-containing protein n=1 Tax=Saponaria officinalis TaxID=3572 RepID=A0AAW1JA80_SAPOF